ncbi:hypothetical protein Droror1_Dr00014818 [Drosera rotundifolia]
MRDLVKLKSQHKRELTQQPQEQTKEKFKHMSKKREEIVQDSPSETLITDQRENVPLEFETTHQSQLCKLPRTVIESLARNLNIIDYLMSKGIEFYNPCDTQTTHSFA